MLKIYFSVCVGDWFEELHMRAKVYTFNSVNVNTYSYKLIKKKFIENVDGKPLM